MTEEEFIAKWTSEKASYEAWGSFVCSHIKDALHKAEPLLALDEFFKIPVVPRLKADDSLLGKAFHRGKAYTNPYADIEDKVGLRFVVLLTRDIGKLRTIIDGDPAWTASLDKEIEAERDNAPSAFTYQSTHYVVKAASNFSHGGHDIHAGTPCEVQLRTLLQHAHAELTHDNIYKGRSGTHVSPAVHRIVAKSMALVEVVDDHFERALVELKAATEKERAALTHLRSAYVQHVARTPHVDKSGVVILQAFSNLVDPDLQQQLNAMLTDAPFIAERVRQRYDSHYVFRQSWIIFAYLIVRIAENQTREGWPLQLSEIEQVFTDLGKSIY